jgi:predicted DNA-binding transcriptional regulator AlpA
VASEPLTPSSATIARAPATCQLFTIKEVCGLLKIHPATAWRLSAMAEAGHGDFPKPLRLSAKIVRWRASDVSAYIDRLSAGESRP